MKKKIIYLLQYFVILILLVLIVYFAYQKFILKNKSVSFLNYNFFVIISGSMEPTIHIKDLVVTHPKDNYNVGDIVAFRDNNAMIVHRIIDAQYDENGDTLFVTKGDYNNAPDINKLSPDNIIGSYRFTIPLLGSLILFFSSNPILVIGAIIILIVIYFIVKMMIRSYKEHKH